MSFVQFYQCLLCEFNGPLLHIFYLFGIMCFVFPSIFIVFPDSENEILYYKPVGRLIYWAITLILGLTAYISLMAGHPLLGLIFCYDLLLWIVLYIVESNTKPQKQLRSIIVSGDDIKFKDKE